MQNSYQRNVLENGHLSDGRQEKGTRAKLLQDCLIVGFGVHDIEPQIFGIYGETSVMMAKKFDF
jgi:hypothetical protein